MQAVLGIAVLIGLAWLLSESRGDVRWRTVIVGLLLQLGLVLVLLKVPTVSQALLLLNGAVHAIEQATTTGAAFVFGYLGGGESPFEVSAQGALYLFAFRVLPQILVFSVLVALFWYWRILPLLIRAFGAVLRRTMDISGAIGTAAAASVFLGMVETPLVVRAYLASLSRSELFTLMTCGMATVAGSIMVLYASVLGTVVPGALGHILIASVINVIGAVYLSQVMVPETDAPSPDAVPQGGLSYTSNMDAITRGTSDGLRLAVNVGAMVLVLISLVALMNQMLSLITVLNEPLTLQRMMGWVFSPIAWLMGIPWCEAQTAGALLGTKLILNELVAYLELAALPQEALSESSRLIMTYALCGFANFGSLGIMLGGLNTLVPEQRAELLSVSPKTLLSGTLVTCITGALVSVALTVF